MQLGHVAKADGRWRIFAFAGAEDAGAPGSPVHALCDFLATSAHSPVLKYTPPGADGDAAIDVRAVFRQDHRSLALERMPAFLLPRKGRMGLIDYEKMFCRHGGDGQDIFALRGVATAGCMVVLRPDQYVGQILPLDGHAALAAYFDQFMRAARR
jgi:phenol 2-monooxygenase (NADPH)